MGGGPPIRLKAWPLVIGVLIYLSSVTIAEIGDSGGGGSGDEIPYNVLATLFISAANQNSDMACKLMKETSEKIEKCTPRESFPIGSGNTGAPSTISYTMIVKIPKGLSEEDLLASLNVSAAQAKFPAAKVIGEVTFRDIKECRQTPGKCSPNAHCKDYWGTFQCKCKDGYVDMSVESQRPGSVCGKKEEPTTFWEQLDLWVWVLIGIGAFLVVTLLLCCCCFYMQDPCCSGGGGRRRRRRKSSPVKIIKETQVIPQPIPVPVAPEIPPCTCGPTEDKKVIIQLDSGSSNALIQNPYGQLPGGHSAFIANNLEDGNVYVANPSLQQYQQAPLSLPWAADIPQPQMQPQMQEPQYASMNYPY